MAGGYLAYGGSYLSGGLGLDLSKTAEKYAQSYLSKDQAAAVGESIRTGVDPSIAYGKTLLQRATSEARAQAESLGRVKTWLVGIAVLGGIGAGVWWLVKKR